LVNALLAKDSGHIVVGFLWYRDRPDRQAWRIGARV